MNITWSDEAEQSLLGMTPSDADAVFTAVEQLATTRRGFVRDMLDGTGVHGVYVGAYVVLFKLIGETLTVIRVRRRA